MDALVNCHARSMRASLEAMPRAAWLDALEENLLAPMGATRALLPLLRRSGDAAVVLLGSVDGARGNPQVPAYSVAKGALVPLAHVMADEFAPQGIRVHVVARAAVEDPDVDAGTAAVQALVAATPLARLGRPEDIAAAASYLASPDAADVTGTVLVVDGGRLAATPGTRPERAG